MRFNNTLSTENGCVQRKRNRWAEEKNLSSKVVLKLSEPIKNESNLSCDSLFTNLELGRKLLMQPLTIVGTI